MSKHNIFFFVLSALFSAKTFFSTVVIMFKFKFETVLSHRKFLQEACQKALAEEKRLLREAHNEMRSLINKEKITVIRLQQQRADGSASISEILLYMDYLAQLRDTINTQLNIINKYEGSVNRQRNQLMEAVKQCQILEKLKEQQAAVYKQQAAAQENKLLHEISVNRICWQASQDITDETA